MIGGYTELAPNCKRSVIHRQVIGPYEMEHDYGLMGGNTRRILRDRKRARWSRRGGR